MFLPLVAVGRLDFGSGDVADIVLEMFIILSQLTWGDMDLPPMEKGAGGTPGPTREWGAETTEGDTTNEVVRGGWDDGKGGGREQGSDGGPVIIINYSIKPVPTYNYIPSIRWFIDQKVELENDIVKPAFNVAKAKLF